MGTDRNLRFVLAALPLALSACVGTSQPRPAAAPETADGPPRATVHSERLHAARVGAPARRAAKDVPVPKVALAGLPQSQADANTMVVHFIDVGQGDAELIEFSCGAVLIDTGGEKTPEVNGRERLKAYLADFFQRRLDLAFTLDLVLLSHPHADHTDGVDTLLSFQPSLTIKNVVDNGITDKGSGIAGQKALQNYAQQAGAGYEGVAESDITSTAGMTDAVIDPINCRKNGIGVDPKISVLWGRVDLDTGWANNANNDSVMVRVDFEKASFLFTGDLEQEGIASMLDSYSADLSAFDVDVLKVDHHGSKNGLTPEFVAAISPKIAVMGAGDSGLSKATFSAYSFAHPNRAALQMLLDHDHGVSDLRTPKIVPVGISGRNPSTGALPTFTQMSINRAIYATGWDGNIAVAAKSDGTLSVETEF